MDIVHSYSPTISSSDSEDEDLQLFGITRSRGGRRCSNGTRIHYNRTRKLPKWLIDITFDLHTVIMLTNAQNSDPMNGHIQPSYHTVNNDGTVQRTPVPQDVTDPTLDDKAKRLLWMGRTLHKKGTDYADKLLHGKMTARDATRKVLMQHMKARGEKERHMLGVTLNPDHTGLSDATISADTKLEDMTNAALLEAIRIQGQDVDKRIDNYEDVKRAVGGDGVTPQTFGKDNTDFPSHYHYTRFTFPQQSGISDWTCKTWVRGSTDHCGCRKVDCDGNTHYEKPATPHQNLMMMTAIDETHRRIMPHPFPADPNTPEPHPAIFPDLGRYGVVEDRAYDGSVSTRLAYTATEGGYTNDERNTHAWEWLIKTVKMDDIKMEMTLRTDGTSSSSTGP